MDSVASRYAIALNSLAREENKVMEYIKECEMLLSIMDENPDLLSILKDYGLTKDEKKETVDILFKDKIKEYILNLFYVVIDNSRGNAIYDILKEFVKISYQSLNIKKGYVYSTIKLTTEEMKGIEKKVSDVLGSTVTLENKIDKSLIGGFKVQIEDYIIDESIHNKINKLKETLKGDMFNGN